jgi:hypothetical protein
MKPKTKTVTLWVFGVALALLPLGLDYIHQRFAESPSWLSVIVHGELLLVSVAILADAIARAAASDDEGLPKTLLLLGSVLVVACMIFDLGEIRARIGDATKIATDSGLATIIQNDSIGGFIASMVMSGFTILILED